jgi:hypothetical protein
MLKRIWPVLVVGAVLLGTLLLQIKPYDYRLSSVFHMDEIAGSGNPMPSGFVILSVPSYDGAQYYQIARNIPKVMNPARWHELRESGPLSYSYQRFLLPLLAFLLSLGNTALLPFVFVGINLLALLLAAWLIVRSGYKPVYVIALSLSPAATLAMHFTLAEPLTILLLTFVVIRYLSQKKFGAWEIFALSLAVVTREVNILFVLYLLGWSVLRKQLGDMLKLMIPTAIFFAFHFLLFRIFGDIPFLTSTGARQLPGSAALDILLGNNGWNGKSLSTIALLLFFFIPCFSFIVSDVLRKRRADVLSLGALAFFGLMLTMPDYIWGSITSIGRVITPIYPLTVLLLATRDSFLTRTLAGSIALLGTAVGIGLALVLHPFTLA